MTMTRPGEDWIRCWQSGVRKQDTAMEVHANNQRLEALLRALAPEAQT